eukprot:CAMPEP_0170802752 /NCGR_PEP_ID=MMETSP0733-20121128/29519_1 /TAXON_ID=186038 /ORGANISM="Fragilariopsis kerguelensis, Strain L26-C5" /LENGTH=44 /DNA_ID= /DNA_START= /DNA_END= /DNA_ORIENTATION=
MAVAMARLYIDDKEEEELFDVSAVRIETEQEEEEEETSVAANTA